MSFFRELRQSMLLQLGGEHSHEVKHPNETHHNALEKNHGHATDTLETHNVHTTVEVRSESRDHGHGKAVKVSLHREGSDDSGERSPGSPTIGKLALVDDWERKITRSSSP